VTVSKPAPIALALVEDAPAPRKKSRAWPALIVAAGAIGFSAFAFMTIRKARIDHATKVEAPAAPAEISASAPAPKSQKVDTVKVRISVDPPDSIVKLDGRLLDTNPFVSALPRDSELHELTAYAEGCKDLKQVVHLSQDVDLLIALKRIKGFVRSTAPRSASAAAAAKASPAHTEPTAAHAPAATPSATAAAPAASPEPGMDLQGVKAEPPAARTADEENPYAGQ
jgi:hypothetical protein